MFKVLECVTVQHDQPFVVLAASISFASMFAFFLLLARARECTRSRRDNWLAISAFAGGVGVWATHFVAMLAYSGTVAIEFDFTATVLSAATAVLGFWLSLHLLKGAALKYALMAAISATLSIAAMHFTGMSAIKAAADIHYDLPPIFVGGAISVLILLAAFWFVTNASGWSRILLPTVGGILAVCTLHFTAVASTELVPNPTLPAADPLGIGRLWLVVAIAAVVCSVALATISAVFIDRYMTDLKGFANATLDGLVVIRDGGIVEMNARFSELMRRSEKSLMGIEPDTLLLAADGLPVCARRAEAIEAAPRFPNDERIFELAVHAIEYQGRPCEVLAVRDLTEKRAAQRQIEHMARHDALTDLPNRMFFEERLANAVARPSREPFAVLALDLDRFKAVNDIFGHAEGDRVLKTVSSILKRCVNGIDTAARIGGDEFIILQVGVPQPRGARKLSEKILEAFRLELNTVLDPTAVGVSIGVALYPNDGKDAEAIRHAADIALYRAKTEGRGLFAFYSPEMDQEIRERRQLEADLRHAMVRGQIGIAYQPLFATSDGRCTGYEALVRWNHPERGQIPPDVFIPIAEETGTIVALGEWVLREACRTAAEWESHLSIAVNLSPVQFRLVSLPDTVRSVIAETGLDPTRLELEVTESALMKDRLTTLELLRRMKKSGVRIVMDDFGTGYSSLSNLQSFPFDKIKIDRSFITSMETDVSARAIVRAIVGLGRSLDLPVVAEGIETFDQHRMVIEEGCEQVQGFLFGRPANAPAPIDPSRCLNKTAVGQVKAS
ncbi:bifunctional diguanylate cyclase/phosphodiesterase [Brucella sp. RRSP16]|uniref:Diguanylate cyclase/phosphodiesterase n=1 Tax=Ochrobactrum sp. PW1 TaxID=1882222 RepID=A0A292GJA7_9HYPH|nr:MULTISPECIES: EAL domain-containing protein [Brucella]MCH6202316.1 EAL domain-containing protein [Brucella ciceri]BBA72993.1 diguanylate cyclase/phosphodiesterase [Ochrobactrum sp. PW1]